MNTELYGKCILAGEHSVLRGGRAVVLPVRTCSLNATVEPSDKLSLDIIGTNADEYRFIFPGLLDRAIKALGAANTNFHFEVNSRLPIGTGLGASAALCVLIGRWAMDSGWIDEKDVYSFSRQLENVFHGESSGVDIACAMSTSGIAFRRGDEGAEIEPLEVNWKPSLYLTYSGHKGITSEMVQQVKKLIAENPEEGERLDQEMQRSVELATVSLKTQDEQALIESMCVSADVFREWGLYTDRMKEAAQELESQGAAAVRSTGSGGGGFLLSYWKEVPPEEVRKQSISLWV